MARIMVAFDETNNSMRTIDFIRNNFSNDNHITLFTIIPSDLSLYNVDSSEPFFKEERNILHQLQEKKKKLIEEAQQNAKKSLLDKGFTEENLTIKTKGMEHAGERKIASEVIKEAHSGYDIIVTGRKGRSEASEFLFGSVSQKLIHSLKDVSVVVVN